MATVYRKWPVKPTGQPPINLWPRRPRVQIGAQFTPSFGPNIVDLILLNRQTGTLYIDIGCRRWTEEASTSRVLIADPMKGASE